MLTLKKLKQPPILTSMEESYFRALLFGEEILPILRTARFKEVNKILIIPTNIQINTGTQNAMVFNYFLQQLSLESHYLLINLE